MNSLGISGNCGAQQYYSVQNTHQTLVSACKNSLDVFSTQVGIHRLLPQCCVHACLTWVHLFMNSWGPSAALLRRCDKPLLNSTLAVKHLGKSNALHSLPSYLHHMLSDVKQGGKRMTYLISSPQRVPSTAGRTGDESKWVAAYVFEHGWLSETASRDHRPYLCREV